MKLILFFLPLALLAQIPVPGGGGGGGGTPGVGCTVSGSAGQIVYNNGSTGCSSSAATATSGGAITAPQGVSTGASPPSVTAGTGGLFGFAEGTVPTVGAAAGVDLCYADSTAHNVLCSFNNGSYIGMLLETAIDTTVTHVLHASATGGQGTFSAIVSADLPAQYKIWTCETGMGDGLNAITSATYLQSFCYNTTGVTVTLTGLKCYADAGTPTLNAAGNTLGALLTGAVTCTTGFAAGTQSANVLLTSGDYIKFTFVAGGTATQTTWVVTGTY